MTGHARANVAQRLREITQIGECSYAEFARLLSSSDAQLAKHMPCSILGDPARAILLEIFIANEQGRPCSMKEAYLASSAPQSTATRYINFLAQEGHIATRSDRTDGRRVLLHVTPKTSQEMKAYLRAVAPFSLTPTLR